MQAPARRPRGPCHTYSPPSKKTPRNAKSQPQRFRDHLAYPYGRMRTELRREPSHRPTTPNDKATIGLATTAITVPADALRTGKSTRIIRPPEDRRHRACGFVGWADRSGAGASSPGTVGRLAFGANASRGASNRSVIRGPIQTTRSARATARLGERPRLTMLAGEDFDNRVPPPDAVHHIRNERAKRNNVSRSGRAPASETLPKTALVGASRLLVRVVPEVQLASRLGDTIDMTSQKSETYAGNRSTTKISKKSVRSG